MHAPDEDPRFKLAAPRYCDRPFPPYHFTPVRDPHPVADPCGHSYLPPGATHPPVAFFPPDQWRQSSDYLYGCDLYNHGYWWEAHEAWEGLWRVVPKETAQRRYLQGVIQAGACHLKLLLGHADGVARLRESSCAHLTAALQLAPSSKIMGTRVDDFMNRYVEYLDLCHEQGVENARHIPSKYPYLLPE
jgi:hypothetical protein